MNNTTLNSDKDSLQLNETWIALATIDASVTLGICIFGIFVNSCVVCIIVRSKKFQTSTYIFIASMSIANSITLLSVAMHVISKFTLSAITNYSKFLDVGCKISRYMLEVGFTVSTISLAVISVDRYYGICAHQLSHSTWTFKNKHRIKIALIFSWIYPLIVSIPSYFLSSMRKTPPYSCDNDSKYLEYDTIYTFIFHGLNYILPIIIVTIMYVKITLYLRLQLKHLPDQGIAFERSRKRITKVIYMMLIATAIYMVITLPHILAVFIATANKVPLEAYLYITHPYLKIFIIVSLYLAQISWVFNAMFYLIYNKQFRKELMNMLHCRSSTIHDKHYIRNPQQS